MNNLARTGIEVILNLLDEDEVMQLAATTTQHRLKTEIVKNKKDAIDIIVRYSPDFATILNRKTVKRDVLFQYLNDCGVVIYPPITKLALIQKILAHWDGGQPPAKPAEAPPAEEVGVMASKFSEWFYTMMNEETCIGEEHFWEDCSLQLNMVSSATVLENRVDNDRTEVVKLLFNTKMEHGLFFNPNLSSEGTRGRLDVHGLVLVFVCGTLHTRRECVGLFEQMFTLARDPFAENNWKIKNTKLNLKSKCVKETPTLSESGLNQDILSLTES